MTERWRAEMLTENVDFYDGPSIFEDTQAIITRANAELDAAEAENHELREKVAALETRIRELTEPRGIDEWTEEDGPALWWMLPVVEPPYSGSPLNDDFPDYVTHWTPFALPSTEGGEG